ncbi:MAG: esterase-like activity of phytase family protein [Planctomycetota bacterium]
METPARALGLALVLALGCGGCSGPAATPAGLPFERVATFAVHRNADGAHAAAEILAATPDGRTIVYADSANGALGLVDLTDARDPRPLGVVRLGGEPTSVAVRGSLALVAVNTSVDFVDVSGHVAVVDVARRSIVRRIDLGGQPDSIAVSRDGRYAAVAVENERDESAGDGAPPQLPAGFLAVLDLDGEVEAWSVRDVDLTGLAARFPEDPEPEYVDVGGDGVAVVTLQENNHIVLVDLAEARVVGDFDAGEVGLTGVDVESNGRIELSGALRASPREPDAVAWISPSSLATADEGDLGPGGRTFTVFGRDGEVLYSPGAGLEHAVARAGHYPEFRASHRGAEPEGIDYGEFGGERFLFVSVERAGLVLVHRIAPNDDADVSLVQVLPTGVGPEGLLALPQRDLLVVSSEHDDPESGVRATLSVYARTGNGGYPELDAANAEGSAAPIPWGALSGLAGPTRGNDRIYAVHDDAYVDPRVFEIDAEARPPRIVRALSIEDPRGLLGDEAELDLEGIAAAEGALWVVSEASSSAPNRLLRLEFSADGLEVVRAVTLPEGFPVDGERHGFEGVAVDDDGAVLVGFQRASRASGEARIGRFDPRTGAWTFARLPIDRDVHLSGLAPLGGGRFAVLERVREGDEGLRYARIATFDLASAPLLRHGEELETLEREVAIERIDERLLGAGSTTAKFEGICVLGDGSFLVVSDNDGAAGTNGETRLVRVPGVRR